MAGVQGTIQSPQDVANDPSVPGGKVARLLVTDDSSAQLRSRLAEFFEVDNESVNLSIVINSTDVFGTSSLPAVCPRGFGTACLLPYVAPSSVLPGGFQTSFFGGVQKNSVMRVFEPVLSTNTVPLFPFTLADTGVDITGTTDPEQSVWNTLPILPIRNRVLGVTVSARGVFPPSQDPHKLGIWFDVDGKFDPSTVSVNEDAGCDCSTAPGNTYPFTGSMCYQACNNDLFKNHNVIGIPCRGFTVPHAIHGLSFSVGFVPEMIPGCDPKRVNDAKVSLYDDPNLGWMSRFPEGSPYRQCMRLKVMAESRVGVGDLNSHEDLSMDLQMNCKSGVQAAAEFADALFDLRGAVRSGLQRLIGDQVAQQLGPQIMHAMDYAPDLSTMQAGPYRQPDADACSMIQGTCSPGVIEDHLVPASLKMMAYRWFAAPFGPDDSSKPLAQYPITAIQPACPNGSHWNGETCAGSVFGVPVGIAFSYATDPDGDGVIVSNDNCPDVSNPDQSDVDGDGVGDACDICVRTPNPAQDDQDYDYDGIPDSCVADDLCPCDPAGYSTDNDGVCNYCSPHLVPFSTPPHWSGPSDFCENYCADKGDPRDTFHYYGDMKRIDNCPFVNNPGQENSNYDAEIANRAELLGDACDPVPIPAFEMKSTAPIELNSQLGGDGNGTWVNKWGVEAMNEIHVKPLGSFNAQPVADPNKPQEFPVTPSDAQDTAYRFCFSIEDKLDCSDLTWVGNQYLHNGDTREQEDFSGLKPWHRVTMSGLPSPDDYPDYTENPLTFFSKSKGMTRSWDWEPDFAFWHGKAIDSLKPAIPTAAGDGKGRFWTHTDTKVGERYTIANTGLHQIPHGQDPAWDHTRMANHYEDLTLLRSFNDWWYKQFPIETHIPWIAQYCPGCPQLQIPNLQNDCPQCGALVHLPDQPRYASQVLVDMGAASGHKLGVLSVKGMVTPVDNLFGQNLKQTLASDVAWASPAEPSPNIGAGSTAPAVVALAPDGTGVVDVVYQSGRHMLDLQDVREAGLVDDAPSDAIGDQTGEFGGMSVRSASITNLQPRRGFVNVYSRSTERVFVVGGTLLSTGQPAGGILVGDLQTGQWYEAEMGELRIGKVLASTYSFGDQRVWVLDEVRKGGRKRVRLLRVDPNTGAHEVMASWPRLRWGLGRLFKQHWLVTDKDGAVLVVASSRFLHKHVIVRVAVKDGHAQVQGVKLGRKALKVAPVVDGTGYTFVYSKHAGRKLVVKHRDRINFVGGRWSHLGRCF